MSSEGDRSPTSRNYFLNGKYPTFRENDGVRTPEMEDVKDSIRNGIFSFDYEKSLFDRHQKGALGNTIGTPVPGQSGVYNSGNPPSEGNYYADHPTIGERSTPFQEHPGTSESATLSKLLFNLLDKAKFKLSFLELVEIKRLM